MSTMIYFTPEEGQRFQVRAAGIAVRASDGAVLFHKVTNRDHYWSLPGGRQDWNEDAATTVARELKEEIGVAHVTVGSLLLVAETYFTFEGKQFHEIGFYFPVSFPHNTELYEVEEFSGDEGNLHLTYRWLDIRDPEIARLLFPTFLPDVLANLGQETSYPLHLVHHERDGIPDHPPVD